MTPPKAKKTKKATKKKTVKKTKKKAKKKTASASSSSVKAKEADAVEQKEAVAKTKKKTSRKKTTVRRKKKATSEEISESTPSVIGESTVVESETTDATPDAVDTETPTKSAKKKTRKRTSRKKTASQNRIEQEKEQSQPAKASESTSPKSKPRSDVKEDSDSSATRKAPPASARGSEQRGQSSRDSTITSRKKKSSPDVFGQGLFDDETPVVSSSGQEERPEPVRKDTEKTISRPSTELTGWDSGEERDRPKRRRRPGRGRRSAGKTATSDEDPAKVKSHKPAKQAETSTAGRKGPGSSHPATEAGGAEADRTEEGSNKRKRRRRRRKNDKSEKDVQADVRVVDREHPVASKEMEPEADDGTLFEELRDSQIPLADPKNKKGRQMIINANGGDEVRIAILTEGRLEELFIERKSSSSHVGNIYKGRVTNVEPGIQAAFVDFGLPKNGFLHVSDVLPQYFPDAPKSRERVGKKVPRRDRPPIQKCFRRGQEVLVQITKEGVGTKGPTLTTYLSIPGRFLVMMPGMDRLGVSRKIEDETIRRKMREVMDELTFPQGMGFILRTAGLDRTKRELQSDLNYLNRLWKSVSDRINKVSAPCDVYQESDLVIRTLRDVYSNDFDRVVVDNQQTAEKAAGFLRIAAPRSSNVVDHFDDPKPIFHAYAIEEQIELVHSRHVPLPSGGSIVIDSTEAMVAIDVNSGKFRESDDAEETAFKINTEAAEEIARQLRLRDLGGLIVCDFIDMRYDKHKRAIERQLRDALKKHKERARILRMSQFGLIEMTRQRQRPSIKRHLFSDCAHCGGTGLVKTPETMSLEVMRVLQLTAHRNDVARITLTANTKVAFAVLNARRAALQDIIEKTGTHIVVQGNDRFPADQVECLCEDSRGRVLNLDT